MIVTPERLRTLITAPTLQDAIDCALSDNNDFTITLQYNPQSDEITAEFICGIGFYSQDIPVASVASALAVAARSGVVKISTTVCSDPNKIEIIGLTATQAAMLRPRIPPQTQQHSTPSRRYASNRSHQ